MSSTAAIAGTCRELDPATMSAWDLRVHIAEERAGGWGPVHFAQPDAQETTCESFGGADPGDTYALSSDRGIWERWYAAGNGCQDCAEVLHS